MIRPRVYFAHITMRSQFDFQNASTPSDRRFSVAQTPASRRARR
jgi:hypothetical protein